MGEEFLRKRAKRFKHLSDADYDQQLATRHLLSDRPEVFTETYPCIPLRGHSFTPNQEVIIRDIGQDDLVVECGNQRVATIDGSDGGSLREAMRLDTRCVGMMPGQIERLARLSGRVYLRVVRPGVNNDECPQ